jgi:hypothetical protein
MPMVANYCANWQSHGKRTTDFWQLEQKKDGEEWQFAQWLCDDWHTTAVTARYAKGLCTISTVMEVEAES